VSLISPYRRIVLRGSVFPGVLGHELDQVGDGDGDSTMAFHGAPPFEISVIGRIRCLLQERLEHVKGRVEVEVVHVAAIEMQLAHEPWTEFLPLGFNVVAQIIAVVPHV